MFRELHHRLMCRQLEVFLNMSPRSACFIDKARFLVKIETSSLESTVGSRFTTGLHSRIFSSKSNRRKKSSM